MDELKAVSELRCIYVQCIQKSRTQEQGISGQEEEDCENDGICVPYSQMSEIYFKFCFVVFFF